MQNNILQKQITDNTQDVFVVINPSKQQIAFFPKEESQMFTSKSSTFTGTRPTGFINDPDTESESTDTRAFIQRAKNEAYGQSDSALDYTGVWGGVPFDATNLSLLYKYKLQNINSSHTETDYIGAVNIDVPAIINPAYATFKLYNLQTATLSDLYASTDSAAKIVNVLTGFQTLRIPQNVLNTVLTDETAIIANNSSPIIPNYGLYYITVSPNYIRTTVANIVNRRQVDWLNMPSNGELSYDSVNENLIIAPDSQRRNVYECNKTDFQSLPWNFEASNLQSGRLYGSVVEIWDSTETTLKQVKTMAENEFNFSDSGAQPHFTLYPDNVGYDAPSQLPGVGDILRIYPRETSFNQFIIEVNYINGSLQIQNLLSFMMNDAVRDITTGTYEIYDNIGFTLDSSGNFNGNVIQRYNVFKAGNFEARKVIK